MGNAMRFFSDFYKSFIGDMDLLLPLTEKFLQEDDKNKRHVTVEVKEYVDDDCVYHAKKEWENGKLINDEGFDKTKELKETNENPKVCECQCSDDCCSNKGKIDIEELRETIKKELDEEYTKKLLLIEKEVDAVSLKLKETMAQNDRLVNENIKLRHKFNEIRKHLGD